GIMPHHDFPGVADDPYDVLQDLIQLHTDHVRDSRTARESNEDLSAPGDHRVLATSRMRRFRHATFNVPVSALVECTCSPTKPRAWSRYTFSSTRSLTSCPLIHVRIRGPSARIR